MKMGLASKERAYLAYFKYSNIETPFLEKRLIEVYFHKMSVCVNDNNFQK